ncbi:DUF5914 domain-containing protein [Nocardioides bruguierae]|uniref:DUF5914 domain-containing protein n=1 Tax=Nocardioides bruguierae TaxID=2945102 RepID=A0A9X2D9I4_9ACTN|nr:DUF5914 domain-containing protein [Nocardioides bruguierae]MCM0621821.1 DUF5914 domain-containing protein [Nocardioides bruguierae]
MSRDQGPTGGRGDRWSRKDEVLSRDQGPTAGRDPRTRELRLTDGYRRCAELTREYGTTYFWGAAILPRPQRRHVHAVYALCRLADDIVDVAEDSSPAAQATTPEQAAEIEARLADFRDRFAASVATGESDDPVLLAVGDSVRATGIDLECFDRFFRAMAQDLTTTRYRTWDDLMGYMEGSAAVIGEMMLPVLRPTSERALAPARALGHAFQLTNFLRDVDEDLDRGRVYLPQEDIDRFGADPFNRTADPAWRALMRFEIARNRELYAQAEPGLAFLPDASRRCVGTAKTLYAGILERIEMADYDVFARRARVPTWRKAAVAGAALTGVAMAATMTSAGRGGTKSRRETKAEDGGRGARSANDPTGGRGARSASDLTGGRGARSASDEPRDPRTQAPTDAKTPLVEETVHGRRETKAEDGGRGARSANDPTGGRGARSASDEPRDPRTKAASRDNALPPLLARKIPLALKPMPARRDLQPSWREAKPSRIKAALDAALAKDPGGWYVAGASTDLKQKSITRTIGGTEVVLWRTQDGVVAGPGACPHLGALLTDCEVMGERLYCKWHGLSLQPEGQPGWTPFKALDDGVLLWVQIPTAGEQTADAPTITPRPALTGSISAVIEVPGTCEPRDIIANRLDPWHGSWFHPYAFSHLEVDDDASDDDTLTVDVTFRLSRRWGVPVRAEFTCPDARTIIMTIIEGEGAGSVVETHATPLGPGPDGHPRTMMVEATIAHSDRQGFRLATGLSRLVQPGMRHTARRLWVDDIVYAERSYLLRSRADQAGRA